MLTELLHGRKFYRNNVVTLQPIYKPRYAWKRAMWQKICQISNH